MKWGDSILTSRSIEILKRLTEEREPVRIRDIAETYKVSPRTVKYDLEIIRFWLGRQKNQLVRLESQSSAGIWLSGDTTAKSQLTAMLEQFNLNTVFRGQEERVRYLLLFLLLNNGYLTVSALAEKIGVSRNTVLSDLLKAEPVLNNQGLMLVKKAHKGITINGPEIRRRLAIESVMQNFLRANDMAGMVLGLSQGICISSYFNTILIQYFLDNISLASLYRTIEAFAKQVNNTGKIVLTDRDLVGLLIRVCIVIQRVIQGGTLKAEDQAPQHKGGDEELSSILNQHLGALTLGLNLSLSDEEMKFILQTLPGNAGQMIANEVNENLSVLVSELIQQVGNRCNRSFSRDTHLHSDLLAHIRDKWMKYQCRVIEPNPLAADVIRSYNLLFTAVRGDCDQIFGKMGIVLHDSDVAYITLHFQASLERNQAVPTTRALVVCATGRGSARLLKERLEREIQGLHISGFCSIVDIDRATSMTQVDLIISVLPVSSEKPVAVVNPIPRKQDIASIMAIVKKLKSTMPSVTEQGSSTTLTPFVLLRQNIPPSVLPFAEGISQEIIQNGFELANSIIQEFAESLTESTKSGLMLHIFLMMNRVAFACPYADFHFDQTLESELASDIYKKLHGFVTARYPDIPDSEIWAISRYFT